MANRTGSIALVGAGPGSGGLMTLQGLKELQNAQVVLYDRLVGVEVLAMIPTGAEQIDVGKSSGRHPVPQEEINRLLVAKAQEGKRVVRLKGGDPYLFGRGAEELEAAIAQGIPFRVIPGVTSAIAVPAWAGIPVTHREFSSSLHIITGHMKAGDNPEIEYESLVRLGGTLVFLMGLAALDSICTGLQKGGMSGDKPAALIQNGTLAHQRKLVSTVGRIVEEAVEQGFSTPAVFVVGEVSALSADLDWAGNLPLSGKRVLVTRPYQQSGCGLADRLAALGCGVVRFPCIRLSPRPLQELRPVMDRIHTFSWVVFTSAFGAGLFFDTLVELGLDIRSLRDIRFAAIGEKTARAVEERGVLVDYVPEIYDSPHLAEGLVGLVEPGQQVLLFRAKKGTAQLPQALAQADISYEDAGVYDTAYDNPGLPGIKQLLEDGEIDIITFTSGSTVEGFVRAVGRELCNKKTAVCIGQQTAQRAREYGFYVVVSKKATLESMVDCILSYKGLERN